MRLLAMTLLLTLTTACAHTRVDENDLDAVLRVALKELGGHARLNVVASGGLPVEGSNAVARNRVTSNPKATDESRTWVVVEELTAGNERARFRATVGSQLKPSSRPCGTTFLLLLEKHGGAWKVVSNRVVGDCEVVASRNNFLERRSGLEARRGV